MNPGILLYGVTWLYLSLGFIIFMFLPSVVFVKLEDWTYIESLYYTFITLTTIGFGEYIGGRKISIPLHCIKISELIGHDSYSINSLNSESVLNTGNKPLFTMKDHFAAFVPITH